MRRAHLLTLGVVSAAGLALIGSGAAGAKPREGSQADVRLTGSIEVHASLQQGGLSLTLTARAEFDVRLTTNPDDVATVPMTYHWSGTSGSCTWGGSGADGEVTLQLQGVRTGRPLVEYGGSTPYPGMCNLESPSQAFFHGYDETGNGGAITPDISWATAGGSIRGRGSGKLVVNCSGCGAAPGAKYVVRAMWGRGIDFKPREPRPGGQVRMTENVVLLEKRGMDTVWTIVERGRATVRCDVYYSRSKRDVRKTRIPGRWRAPAQLRGSGRSDGELTCGPWRIPADARGSWMGVTPLVTYRGKTLAPVRGGGFVKVWLRHS
jgi:hypothetical protein